MQTSALARFIRYATIETTSREESTSAPSTPGQLVLLRQLATELHEMGASDVALDQYGVLFATIPATTSSLSIPTIGFIAHVDTSPEMPGEAVQPIRHDRYDGRDLVLPDDGSVLRAEEYPDLRHQLGSVVVTASGGTLLGADDKAGVAEIMAAAEYLLAHPEIPHGQIRIAFTPDEEIGRGTDHFDVQRFGAACAYTLDGGGAGELEAESFSADAMTVTFHGFNTHPGYAKDRMVSAIRMGAEFVEALAARVPTPERSSDDDGYMHAHEVQASVERTCIRLLVRDFRSEALAEMERTAEALACDIASRHRGRVELEVRPQYRNMREILEHHPKVVDYAAEAIRRVGLEVRMRPIRGGTDGSRLSFMGLPTPNLFAGQHNIHSRLEWTSQREMDLAVQTIIALCEVWNGSGPYSVRNAVTGSTIAARRAGK